MTEVVGAALFGSRLAQSSGISLPRAMRVDVARLVHRHDVGLEAVDHRARLLARAAVRLVDRDVLAGLLLPAALERRIDLLVELARDVVADVEQRRAGGLGGERRERGGEEARRARRGGVARTGTVGMAEAAEEGQPGMLGQRRRRQRSPRCKLMPGAGRRGALGTSAPTRSTSAGSAVGGEAAGERAADQPLGGRRLRHHRAEEARAAGVGDEQGREVLDVEVAERVGVVLDVDPGEVGVGRRTAPPAPRRSRRTRGRRRTTRRTGTRPRAARTPRPTP